MTVLAALPSPGDNSLDIGPLSLNAYGLMIALGILAAVWLFGRRIEARGLASRDVAGQVGLWAALAGVIGARLYHVITDWHRFDGNLGDIPKIWEGGLGIPGGLHRRDPGRTLGRPPPRHLVRRRGDLRGAVHPPRPGDRTLGKLVQPGAVRSPDRSAVGVGDRRPAPPGRVRTGDDVPSDVPLRVALELRPLRGAAVDRPSLAAAPREPDGCLRRRLRGRPLVGREPAHRPGQRDRRAARQPVDGDPRASSVARRTRSGRSAATVCALKRPPPRPDRTRRILLRRVRPHLRRRRGQGRPARPPRV